jgi:tryptophanyl-tRNA synthetase
MNMAKPVILTGIRANSDLHLGNYLGAILPMVELQKKFVGEYQLNMFVPDLHSFTTPIEHGKLYDQIIQNLTTYIAAGLDIHNQDTFIYRQSFVSAHSELAMILNNFVYFGELQRMTQFKEKSEALKDSRVSAGLFDYPVLMAADILLYGATWVPVGEDQRQHIELARDLALRVNNKFDSPIFVVPAEWSKQVSFMSQDSAIRIRSLRNPDKKMSKSVEDPAGTILLRDDPAVAAKKVMSATTDSMGVIHYDMKTQPGVSNLLQILSLLRGEAFADTVHSWEGKSNYGDLKKAVADQVVTFLTSYQARLTAIDEQNLFHALEASELLMREVAGQRLYAIQKAVGLRAYGTIHEQS